MKKVSFLLLMLIGIYLFGDDNTTPDKFKNSTSLIDVTNNSSLLSFKVLSYTVYYQPKLDDPITITNIGARFTPEVKKIIQRAKPGDVYYIDNIKVIGPDNITRKIAGIAFKIQ